MSKTLFFSFFLVVLIFSCISKYDLNIGSESNILFIDGNLNTLDSVQYVQVRLNLKAADKVEFLNVSDAKLDVIHNDSEIIHGTYKDEGKYYLPSNFRVKVGDSYKLIFQLSDGTKYESTAEKITSTAIIDNVYTTFQKSGIPFKSTTLPGNIVYLDLTKSTAANSYLLWQWRWFEKIDYCVTCSGGLFYTSNNANGGECVNNAATSRITYDYACKGNCWDVYNSQKINIMGDDFTSGSKIIGREIAQIPFLNYNGALIQIYQYSINKSAYDYLLLIQNQSQSTGSLTDTPPASFIGNIKSLSSGAQQVAGNFMVSSKVVKNYWINRDSEKFDGTPYGNLLGRFPNPEPTGTDLSRPPLAPCLESKYRTAIKPAGWIN